MRVGIEEIYGIHPCVEDEPPPRSLLLNLFLADADRNEELFPMTPRRLAAPTARNSGTIQRIPGPGLQPA